jgi:23S rRNA A1618 N6-methylase RlmF
MKGIYKITQESTGKVYIGQSINIDNRWNQHACSVDSLSFHEAYSKDPTDFSFRIIVQNDAYTEIDLDALEKYYIKSYDANNPKRGFNATKGNGESASNIKGRMRPVTGSINRVIHTKYLGGLTNKNILVIGQFRIDTLALYNNITVISDDYNYTCEDVKIIRVSGAVEIMKELDKINAGQFDLIIANPPYNKGNAIINACVTKAKESIVLMPFSCYKAGNLYKHILSLDLADPKAFKDATITTNLCVCNLIDKEIDQTFEELELETFDPLFRKYYKENFRRKEPWQWKTVTDRALLEKLCRENKTFFLTVRSILDGVHKKELSQDIQANLHKSIITDCLDAITFRTTLEKVNIQKWWYSSKIASGLCWSTHKQGGMGTRPIFLPRVDWAREWTDEQILKEYSYTADELLQIMKTEFKR